MFINASWVGLLEPHGHTVGFVYNFNGSANDATSSWRNEFTNDGEFYKDQNRGGNKYCANALTYNSNVGSGANDIYSSFYIFANATTCS